MTNMAILGAIRLSELGIELEMVKKVRLAL